MESKHRFIRINSETCIAVDQIKRISVEKKVHPRVDVYLDSGMVDPLSFYSTSYEQARKEYERLLVELGASNDKEVSIGSVVSHDVSAEAAAERAHLQTRHDTKAVEAIKRRAAEDWFLRNGLSRPIVAQMHLHEIASMLVQWLNFWEMMQLPYLNGTAALEYGTILEADKQARA